MTIVTIDKLIPGGQGIGTLSTGKKALIWGALPGETVEFKITKEKSSFCEGIATAVLTKMERRSNPRDPCYLATSPWAIMDYDYELEQKSLLVAECFRQAGSCTNRPSAIRATITDGQAYFYRNKMEYSLYWDNATDKIHLAFHARGTHHKIPIDQSSIERPEIFAEAEQIVDQLNAQHQSARDYQSILVRCDQQGNVASALFKKHAPHPQMPPLTDQLLGHKYSYSPNGFFQINLPVYELALAEIQKHITTDKVLDLYAGVGTIGLSVARNHHLTLVEIDKAAYEELVTNCKSADSGHSAFPCENVDFSPADSGKNLHFPEKNVWRGGQNRLTAVCTDSAKALDFITPDSTVILDPPRAGCAPQLIERLASTKPPSIIYLSCNPITQARDIAPLLSHYRITTCQPFNFFPRTPHIENLIVLKHR